jgi:hypothetical protein
VIVVVVLLWLASLFAGGNGTATAVPALVARVPTAGQFVPRRPTAPRHLIAVQGPTDARALRVLVTWDRADPAAIAHDVLRNGRRVAHVPVRGEAWDDFAWTDRRVRPGRVYRYAVRAIRSGGAVSRPSRPYALRVRSDAAFGSGRVFAVDRYRGGDAARAQAAIDDARRVGGGVVRFGPRTYTLSRPLLVSGGDIVLRGAGRDRTVLRAGFPGGSEPCGASVPLVTIRGDVRALPGVHATANTAPRRRVVRVARRGDLRRGDVVVFDQAPPERTPASYPAEGVAEDPAVGGDRRHAWEANEVVRVRGGRVTLRFPLSFGLDRDTTWERMERAAGGGIERLTLEGSGPDDAGYRVLLDLERVAHVTVADVRARWANRSFAHVGGYDVRIVGLRGDVGGPLSADGKPCKYRVSIVRAANVALLDSELGRPGRHDEQSFVTVQRAERVTVRSSRFHGSRTYALNEHGGGSQELLFENNRIAAGPGAKFGGILLGNSTWGFAGPAIVRNNLFVGNSRDVMLQENSFETRILFNVSVGSRQAVVEGYGWAGPDTPRARYGSLRLTVAGNDVSAAGGDGIVLGAPASPWFPYSGVRDVVIADNRLSVPGAAIALKGHAGETGRFMVVGNRGSARYRHPAVRAGASWANNADAHARERQDALPAWTRPVFGWERYDRTSR